MSLFPESLPPKPLAERLRPQRLEDLIGQGEAMRMLSAYVRQGEMPHVVFWGPPGCGKTTLSLLMARLLDWDGRSLNATSASVKDIRDLAQEAKSLWLQFEKRMLVFIDEIHRLNKAQQDVLLPMLEAGTFIMAGSTTENPFFSLTQALRSRVQLIQLQALTKADLSAGMARAAAREGFVLADEPREWISLRASGDMRLALTVLESAGLLAKAEARDISLADAALCLSQTQIAGDRQGDNHYDLASAFQKSLRGSDVNAAVYYLARFLASGEDPRFIARRLLITSSEDVGNADPQAFLLATAAFRAVETLGLPEARIPLSQATIYVAQAPKSPQAVAALDAGTELLKNRGLDPIPKHLRDSHYAGAEILGHGKDYVYTHNNPNYRQNFLPDDLVGKVLVPELPLANSPRKELIVQTTSVHGKSDSAQKIYQHLQAEFQKGSWFEIDAEALAKEIGVELPLVRQSLNELVSEKKISFKRMFTLGSNEP